MVTVNTATAASIAPQTTDISAADIAAKPSTPPKTVDTSVDIGPKAVNVNQEPPLRMSAEHITRAHDMSWETVNNTTFGNLIGDFNDSLDKRLITLHPAIAPDYYRLGGETTRKEIFVNTFKKSVEASAATGALVARVLMFVPDFLLGGQGKKISEKSSPLTKVMDRGVVGLGLTYAASGIGVASAAIGTGIGGATGSVTIGMSQAPKHETDVEQPTAEQATEIIGPEQWLNSAATRGADIGGNASVLTVSQGTGYAISTMRVPSTVVKGVLAGTFAVIGAVGGFFAAVVRTIKGPDAPAPAPTDAKKATTEQSVTVAVPAKA